MLYVCLGAIAFVCAYKEIDFDLAENKVKVILIYNSFYSILHLFFTEFLLKSSYLVFTFTSHFSLFEFEK